MANSFTSYLKHVNRTFAKVDPILKTLQVQVNPAEGLVQAYLIHVADKSDTNFRKVLELKGVKKQDQPVLVDLFRVFVRSREEAGDIGNEDTKLVEQSAVLSPLLVQGQNMAPVASVGIGSGVGGLSSASLQSQMNKFDPRDFGNAILSAARDGVDRLQTPGLMGLSSDQSSATANGSNSGLTGLGIGGLGDLAPSSSSGLNGNNSGSNGQTATSNSTGSKFGLNLGDGNTTSNLNENLKILGRFFRRDTGGKGGSGG